MFPWEHVAGEWDEIRPSEKEDRRARTPHLPPSSSHLKKKKALCTSVHSSLRGCTGSLKTTGGPGDPCLRHLRWRGGALCDSSHGEVRSAPPQNLSGVGGPLGQQGGRDSGPCSCAWAPWDTHSGGTQPLFEDADALTWPCCRGPI